MFVEKKYAAIWKSMSVHEFYDRVERITTWPWLFRLITCISADKPFRGASNGVGQKVTPQLIVGQVMWTPNQSWLSNCGFFRGKSLQTVTNCFFSWESLPAINRCRSVDILAFDEKHFQSSFNDQTDISEGHEISCQYFCDVKPGAFGHLIAMSLRNKLNLGLNFPLAKLTVFEIWQRPHLQTTAVLKPSHWPTGGLETVHQDRTLLLMWPDYMGFGTYGLQCLQQYKGQKLILIGEWKDSTFGSYAKGISEHGQSFSLEFQQKVEDWRVKAVRENI